MNATGNAAALRLFRFQRQGPGVETLLRSAIIGGATGKLLRAQLLGPHAKYKIFGWENYIILCKRMRIKHTSFKFV